ncbi:hypothetical protein STEG23_032340, partial [Scotinomys teguina]
VTGLTLSQDLDDLAILYLATVQSIAFGTRFIIEAMQAAGHSLSTLFLCGGLSKNPLFVQMHADITGMPVVLSQEVESVLVGAAVLGACASGDFTSVQKMYQGSFLHYHRQKFTDGERMPEMRSDKSIAKK